ncbi:tyrosine--tRNA ligase [Candidatus Saccharibacteria bacterium]|jgi:tyrosyl-tRNA synthetase|nr:tyrosine--tRNA ligase [Candidatus Saccharibacteria bacterium]
MTLAEELTWRGFVNQTTFTDITDVNEPRTLYIGVDPSADSMTIGNFASMMMVRHFLDYGHKVIFLVGGATGMIGDPDGKKQERDLRDRATVDKSVEGLRGQIHKLFSGKSFEVVDNSDWFRDINYIDFLHSVGKHVSMTQLLDRDFVQQRIGEGGSGISYAEFSYSLIQGYDFLHLYREKGVTLQLAGADQWGNGLTGVSLVRKLAGGEAHVYTTPLVINKQTGVKFGKSEGGAVWLDAAKTSPYKFYQFWLNIDDETSESSIKMYTLLNREDVESLIDRHRQNPGSRELQKTLAYEVTRLVHGDDRARAVQRSSDFLFGAEQVALDSEVVDVLSEELPVQQVGTSVVEALVSSGFTKSKGEARRLIEGGAVSVNGKKTFSDQSIEQKSLIKKGKNSFILVI